MAGFSNGTDQQFSPALSSPRNGFTYTIGGSDINLETDANCGTDCTSFIPGTSGTMCLTTVQGQALTFPVIAGQQYWMAFKSIQHSGNTVGTVTVFA